MALNMLISKKLLIITKWIEYYIFYKMLLSGYNEWT